MSIATPLDIAREWSIYVPEPERVVHVVRHNVWKEGCYIDFYYPEGGYQRFHFAFVNWDTVYEIDEICETVCYLINYPRNKISYH